MTATETIYEVEAGSRRVDGGTWKIQFHRLVGSRSGPATAIVAGILGDKPLAVLALHELRKRLLQSDLAGTVILVPASNLYGLTAGTRDNPDGMQLNRRFPGRPAGFLSDQMAHALFSALMDETDCIIDLHSGTPGRGLHYTYDYGNLDLSASFGYLPVVVNRHVPGQLSQAVTAAGGSSFLAEFGGGESNDPTLGVKGCLNTLRYRGHLDSAPTGPDRVAILDQVKVFLANHAGALDGRYGPSEVGVRAESGPVGWITDLVTGERLEEFVVDEIGSQAGMGPGFELWGPGPMKEFTVTEKPFLMLAPARPAMVQPGEYTYGVGWPDKMIPTPRRQ
jgi:hypothetical protein